MRPKRQSDVICRAIEEAVWQRTGSLELVGLVKNPEIADKIAELLMSEAGQKQRLEGLSKVSYVEVDYDDPRWQLDDERHVKINVEHYDTCNEHARNAWFPLRHEAGGKYKVGYAWMPANFNPHGMTIKWAIEEIRIRRLRHPDRAIGDTVLDAVKHELKENPSIVFCGDTLETFRGDHFGFVYEHIEDGRVLKIGHGHNRVAPEFRILVVVSEERL